MRASEWQYLCAVHDPPKPCCAIDYCCHTLDWTNNILTSQKNFPSRMSLDGSREGGGGGGGQGQLRQLTNIFRRVYRIFAHAWFQHREMYWKVEQTSGLYVFFKTVCDVYNLIPEDNYTVPPEAEGLEPLEKTNEEVVKPKVLRRKEQDEGESGRDAHLRAPVSDGATTKRHRHTPSVGSESITTVLEDPEEEEEKAGEQMEETVILSSEPPEYSEPDKSSGVEEAVPAEDPPNYDAAGTEGTTEEVDVPIIAVDGGNASLPAEEEIAKEVEESVLEPEAEVEATPDVVTEEAKAEEKESQETAQAEEPAKEEEEKEAGEKEAEAETTAPSSALSDTSSIGSWQVLTNEAQPPSEVSSEVSTTTTEATETEQEAETKPEIEAEKAVEGGESSIPADDGGITASKEEASEVVQQAPAAEVEETSKAAETEETSNAEREAAEETTTTEGETKEEVSEPVVVEENVVPSPTTSSSTKKEKENRRESKIPIRAKSKDELKVVEPEKEKKEDVES